jgi:hypothetical protein
MSFIGSHATAGMLGSCSPVICSHTEVRHFYKKVKLSSSPTGVAIEPTSDTLRWHLSPEISKFFFTSNLKVTSAHFLLHLC